MRCLLPLVGVSAVFCVAARAEDGPPREQAAAALKKAVEFFRTKVGVEGGYLWRYSDDLARREGEGKATPTLAWVQPPGTPAIGAAFLKAWRATGEPYLLDAAKETAGALVKGQLRSGGWDYRIEFDPAKRGKVSYRVGGEGGTANVSTLDDNTTQAAVRYLMAVDQALAGKDEKVAEAVRFALQSLLKAQYPNGAWPQRFDAPPDPAKVPAKKADYPESWSRTWPAGDYRSHYTLNDNSLADVVETMLEAARLYDDPAYRAAAEKAGDFLIAAQMPEPQPAWAQQYDRDMHPAWARKFEPASVTGGESQGALETLLLLYRETGNEKYLKPIPAALEYLRKSRLPDGKLARFYELKTNKPLYFTKDYKLTYSDADMPTHYGFKVPAGKLDAIAAEYERLRKLDPAELKKLRLAKSKSSKPRLTDALKTEAKAVIAALDDRGRWVEDGKLKYHGADDTTTRVIDCRTFIRNAGVLSDYLAATKP